LSSNPNDTRAERLQFLPPNGSFRRAFTIAELRAAGAGESDAHLNEGVTTLTVFGPREVLPFFSLEWRSPNERPPCHGRLELVGRLAQLAWNPTTPCSGQIAFRWRLDRLGDLVIVRVDPRTRPRWLIEAYAGTWKRVECTPSFVFPHPRRPRPYEGPADPGGQPC